MPQTNEIRTMFHGQSITVTDEGQQAVEALAWHHAVCVQGGHPYTNDNPRVGLNLCLRHYLENQQSLKHYIGVLRQTDEHHSVHGFVDYWGFVQVASTKNTTPSTDNVETLRYYRFTVPDTFRPDENDQPIALEPSFWKLYGQVQERSVVIAVYDRPSPIAYFDFLCVKDGPALPVTRRKGMLRKLWQTAKRQIESSHDQEGYHWRGTTFKQLFESHLYRAVSDLASDQYDAHEPSFFQLLQKDGSTLPHNIS